MKSLKVAIIITILVTIAYAIMLTLIGHENLPTEKTLAVFEWIEKPLPFDVTPWWYLLLCPLIVMFAGYGYSRDTIVGKRSEHHKENIERKYHVRSMLFFMNLVSTIMALGTVILMAILWPILESSGMSTKGIGPISGILTGIVLWLGTYIMVGIWEEFCMALGWNTVVDYDDNSYDDLFNSEDWLLIKFKATLVSYVKIGIIKSFPLLLGITLGFIVRFISLQSIKVFYRVKKIRVKVQTN